MATCKIIKSLFKKIIMQRRVNFLLRILIKPIAYIIPECFKVHFPIVGKIQIALPNRKRFYLELKDNSLMRRLYWKGFKYYEHETAILFFNLAKESNVIFDIGASFGYYTFLAASINEKCKVYAFEPVPRIFEYLKNNIELNHFKNVMPLSYATTNFDGGISLFVPVGELPTEASTLKGFRKDVVELQVPAIRLDSFVKKNNIKKVDLVKLDTEATEHLVLEGMINTICRDKPIIICEVLYSRTEKFLDSLLDNLGYKYFWISGEGLIEKEKIEGDGTYKYNNYLFITKEKTKELKINGDKFPV